VKFYSSFRAGKWKIIASFHKYPESVSEVEFEVKEYGRYFKIAGASILRILV